MTLMKVFCLVACVALVTGLDLQSSRSVSGTLTLGDFSVELTVPLSSDQFYDTALFASTSLSGSIRDKGNSLVGGAVATCAAACGVGETETTACSATTNRDCTACTSKPSNSDYTTAGTCDYSCNSGYYLSGTQCLACATACDVGQYKSSDCTATANLGCTDCTSKPSNSYYTTAGTCDFSCNSGYTLTGDECVAVSPSASTSPSPSITPSITPSASPSASLSASPSVTPSITPSASPSNSPVVSYLSWALAETGRECSGSASSGTSAVSGSWTECVDYAIRNCIYRIDSDGTTCNVYDYADCTATTDKSTHNVYHFGGPAPAYGVDMTSIARTYHENTRLGRSTYTYYQFVVTFSDPNCHDQVVIGTTDYNYIVEWGEQGSTDVSGSKTQANTQSYVTLYIYSDASTSTPPTNDLELEKTYWVRVKAQMNSADDSPYGTECFVTTPSDFDGGDATVTCSSLI